MPPRRNPRRSAGAPDTKSNPATLTTNDSATPAEDATSATTSRTTQATKTKRYESTPVPQQITFPARRKIVRKYGGRRSLPARLEEETATASRRSLKQQTLTQIDYVRSSSGFEQGDLLEDEEIGGPHEEKKGLKSKEGEAEAASVAGRRKTADPRSKRRKTMGDMPTPNLEKKGPSFQTQTLTQLLGNRVPEMDRDELRVEDEAESAGLPSSGGGPSVKHSAPPEKGKGKALATPIPHTPTGKRIKVNLDEVPSSQPTPFTPLLGHSPIPPARSPLTQKSTNVDAPLPTIETVSKLPRSLVIQDSYSMDGSSAGYLSSTAGDTPVKKERGETPSQIPKREPLAEIPVASLELGVSSTSSGVTPTTRRKRLFTEIPDSDDELESLGSTPFKTRSTQQTPLAREPVVDNFEIAADPRPPPSQSSRKPRAAVTETPASSSRSNKENESPAIKMWEDEDAAGEGDDGGSPTPKGAKSPNTASQFWTASAENVGCRGTRRGTSREPLAELVVAEDPTVFRSERPSTAPRASQFHGSMGESSCRGRHATPQLGDSEETASEAEEEPMPVSILRKATSQGVPRADGTTKRRSTPEPNGPESSTSEPPDTPTPIVRKVQIEMPQSSGEEVCKETPRKPHRSSPIYQRHTQSRSQARSQFYSQALESQRVPLEVIRSLGPQTDRSDILISIDAKTVGDIVNGIRDHVFRNYRFPVQASRCWIFTELPVGEVKYMATLGPAQEPGQIDSHSGRGNTEFNRGTLGYKFAHKLLQVYQLNNPVPLAEMEDNGLGAGPPQRYKYVPPAIVGQLLMNLRCPLFAEGDFEDEGEETGDKETEEKEEEGEMTISQELADQIRSDIIHSTQLKSSERRRRQHRDDEYLIPASQSPTEKRSVALKASAPTAAETAAAAAAAAMPPPRSSQRLRDRRHPGSPGQTRRQPTTTTGQASTSNGDDGDARRYVPPSQATTASDVSASPSQAPSPSFPPARSSSSSSSSSSSVLACSVPRPPLPDSGELSLLPELPRHDRDRSGGGGTGLLLHLSSSQVE
ncbi:hypothetical protein L209DRAFT_753651 [Thermothelomyces heterothallicus CBS 203.75]